ncbi:MAG: histidine triad nucleotide-binding protein [Anaerolineales bacterium]|nr:histidine triad nucleotide-binding protein [Anaerolineales bacterium]
MSDCIFCKIIAGEIPSEMVYEDDLIVAFRDINPAAPVHVLIVPREHIQDNNAYREEMHGVQLTRMFTVVQKVTQQEGIAESGYRLVFNTGPDSGQLVPHLHLHVLGGQKLKVSLD